jgi:hypothetical protein
MAPAGNPVPDTLFVFIDESGNFDFSPSGTRFFVMAAVAALAPLESAAEMQALRYRLLAQGLDLTSFHASKDRESTRDAVFGAFSRISTVRAHVMYGSKHQAGSHQRSDTALHSLFGHALLEFAIRAYAASDYRQVVVIFDQALTRRKQGAFKSTVKPQLKALAKPFHLYFQPMHADANGQIADYVAWSKFVQLERDEHRPWMALQSSLQPTSSNLFAPEGEVEHGGKSDRPD